MKVAVIFGGKSNEHQVSIVSGTSVISHLDKNKYTIYPIYISEDGEFYEYTKDVQEIKILTINDKVEEIKKIDNIVGYLKDIDVVFPVLHGRNGEDGTIQGFLSLLGKRYVGCHTLASSICMDKEYTKMLLKANGINVAKGICVKKYKNQYILVNNGDYKKVTKEEILEFVKKEYELPIFIKAVNSGSSVGVNKVTTYEEFYKYLEDSFKYDTKVLIEEGVRGREVECAVLGNNDLVASTLGEVLADDNFYSFDSKYNNSVVNTVIPANIDEKLIKSVQEVAKKAYQVCNCEGLSRVDFFIQEGTNKIILNEINTLPGFTEISMYPKLMENAGISYSELLDKLIELAR